MQIYAILALLLWVTAAVAYVDRNAVKRVENRNMRIAAKVQKESIETVTRVSAEKQADAMARKEVLDEKLAKLTRLSIKSEASHAARTRALQGQIDSLTLAEGDEPPACEIQPPLSCEIPPDILELLQE